LDKSEDEVSTFVFVSARAGERHGDGELHVPAVILDRVTINDHPGPYKYSSEAFRGPVLPFSPKLKP
jgi:hypothetical protein